MTVEKEVFQMQKMKKVLSMCVIFVIVFCMMSVPAYASSDEPSQESIQTYYPLLDWSHIQSVTHGLNGKGTTINYSASIIAYSTESLYSTIIMV